MIIVLIRNDYLILLNKTTYETWENTGKRGDLNCLRYRFLEFLFPLWKQMVSFESVILNFVEIQVVYLDSVCYPKSLQ